MENIEDLTKIAILAANITRLSMQEQFAILAKRGLTLTDINWENCITKPDDTVLMPTQRELQTQS